MSPEIVRGLISGLICAALMFVLGFFPIWFGDDSVWSASGTSNIAMPVGESKHAEIRTPFDFEQPVSSFSGPSAQF